MGRPQKSKIEETHLTVRKRYNDTSPESVSNELLEVREFVVEPAKVGAGFGLTLSLGNFEHARLDVSITLPCYVEEADAAYVHAKKWVTDRLTEEVKSIRKSRNGGGNDTTE